MKPVLLTLCILALIAGPATAARNAGGAILVHTNDAYTYSLGTRCTTPFVADIDECADLITRTDKAENAVIWHMAGFASYSSPGVVVAYHGIEIDASCVGADIWALCGPAGSLEIPDATWPDGSAEGDDISVAFGSPIYDLWFAFYVLRVSDFCGTGNPFWCTSINHVGGYASFVDDSNPPLEDRIDNFGCVVWYGAGWYECPDGHCCEGACCYRDGHCAMTIDEQECTASGGMYLGDNTLCEPNPCPQPDVCCFEDGTCQFLLEQDCFEQGGAWRPEFEGCEPNNPCEVLRACCVEGECSLTTQANCGGNWYPEQDTCEGFDCPVAVERATWGRIKADYR